MFLPSLWSSVFSISAYVRDVCSWMDLFICVSIRWTISMRLILVSFLIRLSSVKQCSYCYNFRENVITKTNKQKITAHEKTYWPKMTHTCGMFAFPFNPALQQCMALILEGVRIFCSHYLNIILTEFQFSCQF